MFQNNYLKRFLPTSYLIWSRTCKNLKKIEDKRQPLWKLEITRRTVENGLAYIPSWMGRSYRNFDTDVTVYYLIPFNLIINILRNLLSNIRWKWISESKRNWEISRAVVARFNEGYNQGLSIGYNSGYEIGYRKGYKDGKNKT